MKVYNSGRYVLPTTRSIVAAALSLIVADFDTRPASAEEAYSPSIAFEVIAGRKSRDVGEYQIKLRPPDYQDRAAVQRHLLFSNILGEMLPKLMSAARENCRMSSGNQFFPDLTVNLVVLKPGTPESDLADCVSTLDSIFRNARPDEKTIKIAAANVAFSRSYLHEKGLGFLLEPSGILTRAMTAVYREGSVVNALASEDLSVVTPFEAGEFLAWFDMQRPSMALELTTLSCALVEDRGRCWKIKPSDFPDDLVEKPGKITITVPKEDSDPAIPRQLHHAVLVGLPVQAVGTEYRDLVAKYCGRDLSFGSGSTAVSNVGIVCRPSTPYTRPWLMLFCIPQSCQTSQAAAVVSEAIAADPDVIALARAGGEGGVPKGPYVVEVKIEQ